MADPIHDYLSGIGRKGGAAGTGAAKARTSDQARANAEVRWGKAPRYTSLKTLVEKTRCRFARWTDDGWIARKFARGASHRLHCIVQAGRVQGKITAEALED